VLPAASGGAKWLALAGLDTWLFGDFLRAPRTRPMHLIGSSIGSQLGALTTNRLKNRVLRLLFGGLVIATVAMILWDLIASLI